MAEDSRDKVLYDLDQLALNDLRLMAKQNDLDFNGSKKQVLARIKAHFGFVDGGKESPFLTNILCRNSETGALPCTIEPNEVRLPVSNFKFPSYLLSRYVV